MQLDAIYDDGRLEFAQPVRFAHGRFRVRVEVPSHELIGDGNEPLARYASRWLRRLEAIQKEVMELPEEELPSVSDRQLERLRAIKLREDR